MEHVIPNKTKEIQVSLINDNNWFTFINAEFEQFEIFPDRLSGGHRSDCTWEMHYTLFSTDYICLEILPDRTIVCHRADSTQIEFIPLNSFKLQVVQ